jgi:Zn-dependent protease with chaperone function
MRATSLRLEKEKKLFYVCFVFSLVLWTALIVSIIGLMYGLFIGLFILLAHAMMIVHIKGNAVKLSRDQLPEIYEKVVTAAEVLGLKDVPEVYVMQAGGILNAFATKFLGRKFVVIYSDLLEACEAESKEMDMIIGHELGHLALGHLKWLLFLAPSRLLPWIGAAYSRAREYSCDRCGLEVVGDPEAAYRGLVVLASGGKYARKVNLNAFVRQTDEMGGFWCSIYELNASHPFLPKRIAALINWKNPGTIKIPRRSFWAYPLSPVLGVASGGAAGAPMIMVATIGIMAAIAIPQFEAYRAKAAQVALDQELTGSLKSFQGLAVQFAEDHNAWPCAAEDFCPSEALAQVAEKGWKIQMSCEEQYFALIYPQNDQRHYKVVYLNTGEIKDGVFED